MTNKLPVVGKWYKYIHGDKEIKIVKIDNNGWIFPEGSMNGIPPYVFEVYYKELPEDKQETKPETPSHISESDQKLKEELDQCKSDCIASSLVIRQLQQENLHLSRRIDKTEPSPEVRKAMEGLRNVIKSWDDPHYIKNVDPRFLAPILEKTFRESRNLLSALDAQFANNKTQAEEVVDNKIEAEESIWDYVGDIGDLGLTPEQICLFELIFSSHDKLVQKVRKLEKQCADKKNESVFEIFRGNDDFSKLNTLQLLSNKTD